MRTTTARYASNLQEGSELSAWTADQLNNVATELNYRPQLCLGVRNHVTDL